MFGRKKRKEEPEDAARDAELFNRIIDETEPYNALTYMPEQMRPPVESALRDLEETVASGQSLDEFQKNLMKAAATRDMSGPIGRMYSAITADPRMYTPALIVWSLRAAQEACARGGLQHTLTRFFEDQPVVSIALVGDLGKPSAQVYEVDGEQLTISYAEFPSLSSTVDEKRGLTAVSIERPNIEQRSQEPWERDYRALRLRVWETQKKTTSILLKTLPGMDRDRLALAIADSFAGTYAVYQTQRTLRQRETDPKEG
ncbi:MAG: hypothetical protein ABH864_06210 [archaeon]